MKTKHLLAVAAGLALASAAMAQGAQSSKKLKERVKEIITERCSLCHGARGESASGTYPRLAGQHPSYLETQLVDFNKRERTNDNAIMHTIASKMTLLEIKAVAAHIGGME